MEPGAAHVSHALGLDLCGVVLDGRYQIIRRIGAGGMASVYEARRVGLERRFAVKILRPELAENESNVRRFLREARSAASIQHNNIVSIEDVGGTTLPVYFVMEYLEGVDLRQELKGVGRFEWSRAQDLTLQIVDALAAAHQTGIIHRDVKPANCFLIRDPSGRERIKVLDFGIAKVLEESQEFTQNVTATHGIVGTVAYMAPEQARSSTVDARTDIYSLGTMLYEMLAGTVPFPDKNPFVVIGRLLGEAPVPLRMHRPDLPADLEGLVMTCLEKNPDARFQSMEAVGNAISSCHVDGGVVGTARVRMPSGLRVAGASVGATQTPRVTVPLSSSAASGSGPVSAGPSTAGTSAKNRSQATSRASASGFDADAGSSAALRRRVPVAGSEGTLLGVVLGGLGLLALGGTATWWALRVREPVDAAENSRGLIEAAPNSTTAEAPTSPAAVVPIPKTTLPGPTPPLGVPASSQLPAQPLPPTLAPLEGDPRTRRKPRPSPNVEPTPTTTGPTPSTDPPPAGRPPEQPKISPDLRNPFGAGKQ